MGIESSFTMIHLLQTALPPSNLPYLISAFVVTGVVFIGYIYFIIRRRQETQAEINRLMALSENEEGAGRESP